jgi:hypothetical protein
VVPEDAFRHFNELGPRPFPAAGTVPHAALLLCEHAATTGLLGSDANGPGVGWRGLLETDVVEHLTTLAASHPEGKGGWRRELAENPPLLANEVRELLAEFDLLRIRARDDGSQTWWFSPATGRWASPTTTLTAPSPDTDSSPTLPRPGRPSPASETFPFDFAVTTPGVSRE